MITPEQALLVTAETALPGRGEPMTLSQTHYVSGKPLFAPFPAGTEVVLLGLGCFWGAERLFWAQTGVYTTSAGYAGGFTANPSYREVCSGQTGHTEVVMVVYEPDKLPLEALLKVFWEAHDPTQGMRQGNDRGSQYRSAIYVQTAAQLEAARASAGVYQQYLSQAGHGHITTEIALYDHYYYAEDYHQQYLAKNPGGYCGLKGTGVICQL